MMTTLTIVLAEITIVLLVVIIVISVKALKRRRRDRDAVNTLVISIKANQPARVEKLAGMLKDTSHLSDDDALNKANELIKKQNKFYQEAIDLYFTRNNEDLSKLDNRLEDLLDQYQGLLKVTTTDNSEVDTEAMGQLSKDIASLSKELEELRSENTMLSTQLKAAEHELDQLGREYVSAFNKPKVDKAKGEDTQDSEAAEAGEAETAGGEQVVAEGAGNTSAAAADDEGLNVVTEDELEPMVVDEPAIEEPAVLEAEEPKPVAAPVDHNAQTELDADAAMMDDSDDQNLFADLGLDELIGEQPGQPPAAAKTQEKN